MFIFDIDIPCVKHFHDSDVAYSRDYICTFDHGVALAPEELGPQDFS